MAKNKVPLQNTFADYLHKIAYRFGVSQVFNDFLTMAMCACTQNLSTKQSYYEEEYLQTIAKYKDSELCHLFPKAFAQLILEMEERLGDSGMGIEDLSMKS